MRDRPSGLARSQTVNTAVMVLLARVLASAVLIGALSVVAGPVVAADGIAGVNGPECADETSESTVFVDLDDSVLPPAFRSPPYSCATRSTLLDPEQFAGYYHLIYLRPTFDQYLDMVRALEREGWVQSRSWGNITYADGSAGFSYETTPDELADLEQVPDLVQHWFVTAAVDGDIQMAWTTGNLLAYDFPFVIVDVGLTFRYSTTGLDAPSTLSALRPVYAPTAAQWGVIGAGSLMLMLIVGWPSTLLNSVVGSRYQSLVRRVTARFRRTAEVAAATPDVAAAATVKRSRLPGWLMWPGFALAAILGSFVDPDFGFNLMSLRLVVTLFLSFLLFNLAAWAIVRRVAVRLQPESRPYLRFRWGSLVLVILTVLVARLLAFEPGVIFGLVAGIAYATTLKAAKSAVVAIVGSAFGLVLALVAWVGYSLLAPIDVDGSFVLVFLVEFLAGVTVKGVSTLPLLLLPLGNLDGAKLFNWKRVAWGASYVVGLAAFMLVLLTIPKAWGEIPGDFARWLILFGAYAVVAAVIWTVNVRMLKRRALPSEKEQGDQPDAITID